MESKETREDQQQCDHGTKSNAPTKCIAVITSGGDAQGMNAAVRAAVRMAIYNDARVFAVHEGYQGLVEGEDFIKEMTWSNGGTIIGTARCQEFRAKEGRIKAAKNLVGRGISNLMVIGGDGSLTGANLFRREWTELLTILIERGEIPENSLIEYPVLNIVGLVGSIDNDFCGTKMTIGADSALHRILECANAIITTASSHRRTFVLEVMGRRCGYLALISGLAIGADWIFIPEVPPEDGWEERMCAQLKAARNVGNRLNIIVLAEGAVDIHGNAITAEQVKQILVKYAQQDTRITVLGHVQRGGSPSAFDRILGCRMGAEAVLSLLESTVDTTPFVIGLQGNDMIRVPLMECVEKTRNLAKAMDEHNFEAALDLRNFGNTLSIFKGCNYYSPIPCDQKFRICIMAVGAPAAGMNAAIRSVTRLSINQGHEVFCIRDGFEGLLSDTDNVQKMEWVTVHDWIAKGGCDIGTKRTLPSVNMEKIAAGFKKYKFHGLVIIGGFEAFKSATQLLEARNTFEAFAIPIIVIPATLSNNVPGTDYSLGTDTSLNVIVEASDRIRQSATAANHRVFVVETMGGNCGYLATMAGLASGADAAYIFEEKYNINDLQGDVAHMIAKFKQDKIHRGLLLTNEFCSRNYDTDFITRLFADEGKEYFTTRKNVLGHVQQGGYPSPFDRVLSSRFAYAATSFLIREIKNNIRGDGVMNASHPSTVALVGSQNRSLRISPVTDLMAVADFDKRIPKQQWWMRLRPLMRILAHHKQTFQRELRPENADTE
ncbi:ATP-dependent 6-phosphofructokinase, muscle type [Trichoplax sp. H2]|nr:ATP-dependent 6-phosphofructokinase, muscle type [Trichoplax sp. H2]|eukprot:RDD42107.1 ATP-dependent 6-phosphofructokinase, muscle type [Trichoplax sp. H2]